MTTTIPALASLAVTTLSANDGFAVVTFPVPGLAVFETVDLLELFADVTAEMAGAAPRPLPVVLTHNAPRVDVVPAAKPYVEPNVATFVPCDRFPTFAAFTSHMRFYYGALPAGSAALGSFFGGRVAFPLYW